MINPMWFRGRLVALLALALVTLSSGVAHAEIGPIAKPPASVAPLPKPQADPTVQPVAPATPQVAPKQVAPKQVVPKQVAPVTTRVASGTTQVAPARSSTPQTVKSSARTIVRTAASTARRQQVKVRAAISAGGRAEAERLQAAIPPALWPAPLAIVGIHEALPSRDAWPDWLLALIAVTASAEAFLLTRLASKRRFAEPTQR
jgi:hypothetical protein